MKIVGVFHEPGAPTGESERWETEDGRLWKRNLSPRDDLGTGVSSASRVGQRIYPR